MLLIAQALVLQAAAFTSLANVPFSAVAGHHSTEVVRPAVLMVSPKRPPGWINPEASPEALKKTLTRVGILWAFIFATGVLVSSSGKNLSIANAPGFTGIREAESKEYVEAAKARAAILKERAQADRAAGRPQTAPPKPWEKALPGGL